MHLARTVITSLTLCLFVAAPVVAQTQTGSILVRMADEQGGVLPGVNLTISGAMLISEKMSGVTEPEGGDWSATRI